MGMTDATSDPVLCICILTAQSWSVTDVKGLNYRASIPYDSSKTMEEKLYGERQFLGFQYESSGGGWIPGLMCISPKRSIVSKILTEAIKYLDHLNVFERRQDGPTPFGLLDGHGSRLQLPLLEYINSTTPDEQRKWIFTLGTPNAIDVGK